MQATQIPVGRRISQAAILVAFASTSLMVVRLVARQPAGLDFLCFWIGGRVALSAPERLYDFQYVTQLQDLPFVSGTLRPYINPPSALLLFAPLSRLPLWAAYVGLMLAGVAVALAAAARAKGPWQLLLLPPVAFSIFCGQPTLLLGGLILLGLTFRDRPFAAGLLFAVAATLKPQLLLLLAPAVAAYLARLQDARWPLYALAATVYAIDAAFGVLSLAAALALPLKGVRLLDDRPLLAGE